MLLTDNNNYKNFDPPSPPTTPDIDLIVPDIYQRNLFCNEISPINKFVNKSTRRNNNGVHFPAFKIKTSQFPKLFIFNQKIYNEKLAFHRIPLKIYNHKISDSHIHNGATNILKEDLNCFKRDSIQNNLKEAEKIKNEINTHHKQLIDRVKKFNLNTNKVRTRQATKSKLRSITDIPNIDSFILEYTKKPRKTVLQSSASAIITVSDILRLTNLTSWLNDEIINFYFDLIVARTNNSHNYPKTYSFNTFFYSSLRDRGYNSVSSRTRKIDIFSKELILIPIHLGNHWVLIAINIIPKTITYYDSLQGLGQNVLDNIFKYIHLEYENKFGHPLPNSSEWRLITARNIPKQMNCHDCGVFICCYSEYLSRQCNFDFNQHNIPNIRKRMAYEIITYKLINE